MKTKAQWIQIFDQWQTQSDNKPLLFDLTDFGILQKHFCTQNLIPFVKGHLLKYLSWIITQF